MLRKLYSILLLTTFTVTLHAQIEDKNSFVAGIDIKLGDFTNDDHSLGGAIIHGGYDINFRNLTFLSIEPKLGVGYFHGSYTHTFETYSHSEYNIGSIITGVSPKLKISINDDDNVYLFVENEFSLFNAFASVKDRNNTKTRRENYYGYFYYTGKIGILFKYSDNSKLGFWIGGSTLSFDRMLNKGIGQNQARYNSEDASISVGLDYYFKYK